MSLTGIKYRTKIVNILREELIKRGLIEVLPQFLEESQPLEPTIQLYQTQNHKFLSTSPESYLKKAMAAGASDCFAFGHCFRNQERENELHSSDFLMLEFYLKNQNYEAVMDLTQELVSNVIARPALAGRGNLTVSPKPWPRISLVELWRKYAKADLLSIIDETKIISLAKSRGYSTSNATWEQIFSQIHFNEVEPHYPKEPFFLIDFPSRISPLAASKKENPDLAERFELLINGIELADGNTENFAFENIQNMMEKESQERKIPYDHEFIKALKKLQGQLWAGVGIGVDRLAMIAGGFSSIEKIQKL